MTENGILGYKLVVSSDSDGNKFHTKHGLAFWKITTLETMTESMDWPVVIVMNASELEPLVK